MSMVQSLNTLRDQFNASERMPVVFLGHGNPLNAIEDTKFSRAWSKLGKALPRPKAILMVSAHWTSAETTLVDVSALPRTIHDFQGFPKSLFDMQYPASGDPKLAREVLTLLDSHNAQADDRWGLDHGAWVVLNSLFPNADVPVFQISLDMKKDLAWHLEIGRTLSELRDRGILILGSGNVVHNLHRVRFGGNPQEFALEFDQHFAGRLLDRDFSNLTDRETLGSVFRMAHPTVDHYLPALTIAGASDKSDALSFMTDDIDLGSVSMRSFIFHNTSAEV